MRAIGIILLLLACPGVFAGQLETILVAPPDVQEAGQYADFTVYIHNSGKKPVRTEMPDQVICRLGHGDQSYEVTANAVDARIKETLFIREQGFVKVAYRIALPLSLEGAVRMDVPYFDGTSVLFAVSAAESPPEQAVADDKSSDKAPIGFQSLDSLFALYQPYLANMAAYEPMYFLAGADPEDSKFQVSFRYRFFNTEGALAQEYPWVKGFNFAYTQTSFWDLASESKPFEDTSYKPELFFLSSNIDTGMLGVKRLFMQTGLQHESNGRGGELSRSTNFLYARPIFVLFNETNRLGLMVAPKIWTYVKNDDETNPDLEDYRGYFDLELQLGRAESFVLGSHLRWAEQGASVQCDLTYPLHLFLFKNLDMYLQAQYFNGYAESLLNYTERTDAFRLGLAIVR